VVNTDQPHNEQDSLPEKKQHKEPNVETGLDESEKEESLACPP
jgi:hypothetical protein